MSPISDSVKQEIAQLDRKIDKLVELQRRQGEQLSHRRAAELELQKEKAQLMQKNELAKSRIESMLNRLKSLEQV